MTPPLSLNRTNTRLLAGSNGTLPEPCTKIVKVGVALALIVVLTVGPIAEVHCPDDGLVWQSVLVTGSEAAPVSADAVIDPVAPTLTVATAKAPAPFVPGILRMPSPDAVAPRATISGTGEVEADSNRVFRPTTFGAALLLLQLAVIETSVAENGPVGVIAKT